MWTEWTGDAPFGPFRRPLTTQLRRVSASELCVFFFPLSRLFAIMFNLKWIYFKVKKKKKFCNNQWHELSALYWGDPELEESHYKHSKRYSLGCDTLKKKKIKKKLQLLNYKLIFGVKLKPHNFSSFTFLCVFSPQCVIGLHSLRLIFILGLYTFRCFTLVTRSLRSWYNSSQIV